VDSSTRRLRSFQVLADELNFSRAAQRLFLTQQALSKQIATLESELGVALVQRTSRTVTLTDAGERFLAACRDTLAVFDAGVADTRRIAGAAPVVLRLGFFVLAALERKNKSQLINSTPVLVQEAPELGGAICATRGMPQDIRISPDGKTFFVADMLSDGVHVVDGATFKQIGFIPTGIGTHGFVVSRDGKRLFVSNRGSHKMEQGKAKEQLDKLVKDGEAGEDDGRRAEKELDDVTHRYVSVVDELVKHKETELLEV